MPDLLFTRRRWLGQAMAALASSALVPGHAQTTTIAARIGQIPDATKLRRVFAAGPPAGVLVATLAPHELRGWPQQPDDVAPAYLGPPPQAQPHLAQPSGG